MFSQRQEWNKIFVDSHLQVTKSYYVFMVRGNGETNSRKEKCCVFFAEEKRTRQLGEVLRGEKDDTPRIVESNMGKECQRTNSKERAVLFFITVRTRARQP